MRIIIECPENILHLEAGYIYADCSFVNFKPLAVRRRTIHFRQPCARRFSNLSKLNTVKDAVISAGANQIGGIEYQSSDLRKYKDQARDAAAQAAREKAEALAKALGNQIGKTYSVEEVPQSEGYDGPSGGLMANKAMDERSQGPSTAPGQLTVRASVVVSFDLL